MDISFFKCFSTDLHGKIILVGYQRERNEKQQDSALIYSACGVQHENENKAYLWIISASQASNWSQITFCNLTKLMS